MILNSMRKFFKEHVFVAIVVVFIAGLALHEGLWQIIDLFQIHFGRSNLSYFIREIIVKVLPALLIAFCIGTLDSLTSPFKNLGNSFLSGAWILLLSVLGSVVNCVEATEKGGKIVSPSHIIFYILFVLMVGLSEELLMRGTITRLLAEKFGKEGKGMVISVLIGAALFGLYHFPNYFGSRNLEATLQQMLATALSGLLLCAIYVKWGNLLALIILHAAFDFAMLFPYGMIEGKSIADRNTAAKGSFLQVLLSNSTFVIAAIIVMVHRKKKEKTDNEAQAA
jgi:membrane protease YdiL (CAAX protease family)